MAEYFNLGEMVEGADAEITARYVNRGIPLTHPDIGPYFKYKCDRNASVEVLKECSKEVVRFNEKAHDKLGDKISGFGVAIKVKISKNKEPHKKPNTGRHKAQFKITHNQTFAEITIPFEHIANALKNSKTTIDLQKEEFIAILQKGKGKRKKKK